jgi:hypothetical protein
VNHFDRCTLAPEARRKARRLDAHVSLGEKRKALAKLGEVLG